MDNLEPLDVVIISPDPTSSYIRLLRGNLRKIGVRTYNVRVSITRIMMLPIEIARLRPRAHVLHLHWIEHLFRLPRAALALAALFTMLVILLVSKCLLRYGIVTTLHNLEPHERLFRRIEWIGFVTILSLSDRLIVHNKFTLESAFRMYHVKPERIELIPHGNFVRAYPNDISQVDARGILGIGTDRTVFSYVGHIRPYKGLDVLSRGFQAALEDNERLHLIIAGNPADKKLSAELLSLKSANVTLIERFLRDEEIQIVVNAANYGLLPYMRNTTPGSLLLFMSFAKPVIVSDIAPVREIVNKDFAITFRPNDVRSLTEAILFADRIRGRAEEMGSVALQEASKYDWGFIAAKTRALYNGLRIRKKEAA